MVNIKVSHNFHNKALNVEYTYRNIESALGYIKAVLESGNSDITVKVLPKNTKKVARFTLLKFGRPTDAAPWTAEDYAAGRYGKETVLRIQKDIEKGATNTAGNEWAVGDIISTIPDNTPDDTWGHAYSIRIDSITEEEVN